jgi:peptidoglycan/LPS O-acetylase OafA/YrhL
MAADVLETVQRLVNQVAPRPKSAFGMLRQNLGSERYPALTGVRALGASAVFFDHFPPQPNAHITLNVLAFFFALSGFLIIRIYYEKAALNSVWLSKYFVNRFARIYPVYFLLLTVAVVLHGESNPFVLLKNYTLTHAFFISQPGLIQPSWSITVEECFYILAPVFMLLSRRYNFLAPLTLACVLLAAALGISRLGRPFLGSGMFVLSMTFFGHFAEFFAGFWLALRIMRLEKAGATVRRGSAHTLAGVAGVLLLILAMVAVYRRTPLSFGAIVLLNNFLIPLPIAVLYSGLLRENTILSRFLSTPLMGLLGRSSYSFYLIHTLVITYAAEPFFLALMPRLLCVVLTFVVTWLLSIAVFLWYEEPVNLFIRRKAHSKDRSVGMEATLFREAPQPK